MTLDELQMIIDEARAEGVKGDSPVILGTQPNYPHAHTIGAWTVDHSNLNPQSGDRESVLVLAEGTWQGYGNRAWWEGETIEAPVEEEEE